MDFVSDLVVRNTVCAADDRDFFDARLCQGLDVSRHVLVWRLTYCQFTWAFLAMYTNRTHHYHDTLAAQLHREYPSHIIYAVSP
jgi:hypothetical protein